MLSQTDTLRYSTTIATNALVERKGPKLGLLTTMGHEDTIYIGKGSQWAHGLTNEEQRDVAGMRKPLPLIPMEMTVGLRERIDCFGNVVIPLQRDEVLEKVQYLVDKGCRGFIVSLLWSFLNPTHEQMVKQIIQEEYPDVYLGNAPVMLSSEVAPKLGEYARTMTTILNGYLHAEMKEELTALAEDLRDEGFRKPVLIVHNTGGTAKTSRTAAVATHNAGPVAGLLGAAHLAKNLYGLRQRHRLRHGRHQLRHRRHGQGERALLPVQPHHRPLAGQHLDDRDQGHRRRRRLHRLDPPDLPHGADRPPAAPAPCPARRPSTWAAPSRPSPTPTSCSATSTPTTTWAAATG